MGSCGISLWRSLIFGVPWLENKEGSLHLGRLLKLGDECGEDSAPELGVWLEGKELDKQVTGCL